MKLARCLASGSLAVAMLGLPSACVPDPEDAEAGRRFGPGGRRWAVVSWDTAFVVGGPEDMLLHLPTRLAADHAGVSVLDRGAGRLLRFDQQGRLLWRFGRTGRGPEEFAHPRDIKMDRQGRTWVLDITNGRIAIIGDDGSLEERIPLSAVGRTAEGIVPEASGGAILLTLEAERPIVRLSRSGKIVERAAFPSPEHELMHPLASQLVVGHDPRDGTWVAAYGLGDGFFSFRSTRWLGYRGRYIESVEFPRVAQRARFGFGRRERVSWLTDGSFAAESVSIYGGRVFVFFGGNSPDRHRAMDVYSVADGSYVESLRLPVRSRHAVYADGMIYALHERPYPTLVAWRPRKERTP
jgi:hypothetical protein